MDQVQYYNYGGLLDRCTLVPGAEICLARHRATIQDIPYILNVSNLNDTNGITSSSVVLCFCEPTGQPNYRYKLPSFNVKKVKSSKYHLLRLIR